ncbi:MAG: hypothetical protein J6R96_08940, partial [Spirochaetaceae bacterium]|nr:hypothetical protein [Spirochaetaceae bacterium]
MIFKITGLEILKIAGLFHPDETSRWSTFLYSCHGNLPSTSSAAKLSPYESEKKSKNPNFFPAKTT